MVELNAVPTLSIESLQGYGSKNRKVFLSDSMVEK